MALPESTPILVVDDEPIMLEIMTLILNRLGYMDVKCATNGVSAYTMMWDKPYGLVISDLNMEPMSGLELLRAVRRDRFLKEIPFIMTTASMNTKKVSAAKAAGVDVYLLKPFTPNMLAEKLAELRPLPLPDVVQTAGNFSLADRSPRLPTRGRQGRRR